MPPSRSWLQPQILREENGNEGVHSALLSGGETRSVAEMLIEPGSEMRRSGLTSVDCGCRLDGLGMPSRYQCSE